MPDAEAPKSGKRKFGALGCSIAAIVIVLGFMAAIALPKFGGFSREREASRARTELKRIAYEAGLAAAWDAGPQSDAGHAR